MNALILILLSTTGEPLSQWFTRETEIYRPFFGRQVAVSETGNLFILDRTDQRLLHYNATGEKQADVAVRGQGPEQLNRAVNLYYQKEKLLVVGRHYAWVFDGKGSFVERLTLPGGFMLFQPVENGWLTMTAGHFQHPEKTCHLTWFNKDLSEQRQLLELPNPMKGIKIAMEREYCNAVLFPNYLAVHPRGHMAVLSPSDSDKLILFHTSGARPLNLREIKVPGAAPLVDRDWAERYAKHYQCKPNFPDYHPLVSGVLFPGDHVQVNLSSHMPAIGGEPGLAETVLYFDYQGRQLSETEVDKALDRVVASHGDYLYIIAIYGEEDEFVIHRVHHRNHHAFLEQHPFKSGRPTMIPPSFGPR